MSFIDRDGVPRSIVDSTRLVDRLDNDKEEDGRTELSVATCTGIVDNVLDSGGITESDGESLMVESSSGAEDD